ncbi:MAG: 1-acyl-sn-glycerol-3-phosphate acyltransferase [Prevotella sp.]|nr:1-acyl-sn-glycerol-3-phosphate acyltransferase [Prevotella sp.]
MWKSFCRWMLYKKMRWKTDITEAHPEKYIICIAPHTSNWDFIIGQLYAGAESVSCNFLMKKEWFFWPMGIMMRKLGGIPVWRSKHTSMTDNLAQTARDMKTFHLAVTPEGTRSANPEWKKGFYFIALKANLPILLYGIDFEKKIIVCRKTIIPNGDVEKQMAEVKDYYKDFKGKNPDNFAL